MTLFDLKNISIACFMGVLVGNSKVIANPGVGKPSNTFVLDKNQYPVGFKKNNPSRIYIAFGVLPVSNEWRKTILRNDTIINLKGFIDSTKALKSYRLIFQNNQVADSIWQFDKKFRLTDQAYVINDSLMKVLAYDSTGRLVDKFVLNYEKRIKASGGAIISLDQLLRLNEVYKANDNLKTAYSTKAVWILSIGVDKYSGTMRPLENCKTDAQSYSIFFKEQYRKTIRNEDFSAMYHEYTLLDSGATKERIIIALRDIAAKSSANDYFIFIYNGQSALLTIDSSNYNTYFAPFSNDEYHDYFFAKNKKSAAVADEISKRFISLNVLQEYIQQIPATNQLFISEAGDSKDFKTEFIKILMQNSIEVATLLNKNRIIIVPNGVGRDDVSCLNKRIAKGPLNYYITSLDSVNNIYDIFNEASSDRIAYKLKDISYNCKSFTYNYFDVFFEKKFLQQYKDIFCEADNETRGMKARPKEMQETLASLTAKHYALVVGTDNYKSKEWKKLGNPIKDARAVADELTNSYGFEVRLLEDKPMDSIYNAIREFYRIAKPNDQLVVYFAGHGDVDNELLDDGFIVCSDSRSPADDPVRNSYIPYSKLQKMLNNIPARQIVVLLDVCHGGSFDQSTFDKKGMDTKDGTYANITNRNVLQLLKDKLPLRTRKFLSSVGSEPAFDGQAGKHSPFANLLLQILNSKGSGTDGIITLKQVYAVLETMSLNETATLKISPHMKDFGNVDAYSEFIFIPVDQQKPKE